MKRAFHSSTPSQPWARTRRGERIKRFYETAGFRQDIDYVSSEDFRVVQFTPPGSECSIIIGTGITSADPGSAQGLHLVVSDIEVARAELAGRGVGVGEVFHDVGGVPS